MSETNIKRTGSKSSNTVSGEIMESVVKVEKWQYDAFLSRLKALNKKAEIFGLQPIEILTREDVMYQRIFEAEGSYGDKISVRLEPVAPDELAVNPVAVTVMKIGYPIIKLGNWYVVGKLEAVEGGNLMFSITDDDQDKNTLSYKALSPITCEHCNTARKRKDGFLLRNVESGEYKQVGKNCLQDFTGIDPGAALFLAKMYDVIKSAKDDFFELAGSGKINCVSTIIYLANVIFIAKKYGFVSAAASRENGRLATYDFAYAVTTNARSPMADDEETAKEWRESFDDGIEMAKKIKDWMMNKPLQSSYDHNAKLIISNEYIELDRRKLAIAASVVAVFHKSQERNETECDNLRSKHVGNIGEKLEVKLTVKKIIPIESAYGRAHIVLMDDEQGNFFKWKTGACPDDIFDGEGNTFLGRVKVKAHDIYKGLEQTAVTHVKVVEWMI